MTPKTHTITLTDHAPVKITEDEWPVIAHGRYHDYDNQYEIQATRKWTADIRVRRHSDGRMIVYGGYDYYTQFPDDRARDERAGVMLDSAADDPVPVIREVGDTLVVSVDSDVGGEDPRSHILEAVRDCIADLPAVAI